MILVTGATGKIGREVVKLLTSKGVPVRALVRHPEKTIDWKGVEVVKGDLDDAASVMAALQGVDKLFLLTSANPKQESAAIDAAKQTGVKLVVKLSSMGANVDSTTAIGRAHGAMEARLKGSGLGFTVLRPGMFAQNFLGYAESIRSQGQFLGAYGEGKAAPIDVRDIAEVAVLTLTERGHEGKTYVLTGPVAMTQAEAAAKLSTALGRPVSYVDVPLETIAKSIHEAVSRAGLPAWLADDMVTMQKNVAQDGASTVSPDFERLTGHPPRSFEDFARDAAAAFR